MCLGFKPWARNPSVAHLVQLIGDQIEDVFAVRLGGIAAIAVMPAELFEVVVQVTHSLSAEGGQEGRAR